MSSNVENGLCGDDSVSRYSFSVKKKKIYEQVCLCEPVHEISNNVVCATSKASDQPAHMRSLIRAFACRMNIL